jgi:glycosyltransferase involved in cell wall biosynthesis
MTVFNEKTTLPKWFESIIAQTVMPDEIVIVDGGSTDGTWEYLQEMTETVSELKIFRETGNIAHGRNFAIKKSTGSTIVVTDAGCVYDKNWFKSIIGPFEKKEVTWSATGFGPWFEKSDTLLTYLISAATIPAANEFKKNWLPSSRSVAFHKDRWQTVGGYPEWIPFCEDVLFDNKLIRKEGWPYFIREPLVLWRPRTKLRKYFKQLYNYTRSEGHGLINTFRQIIRYFVYLASILLLFVALTNSLMFLIPLLIGALIYLDKFWRRWFAFTDHKSIFYQLLGFLIIPFIIAFGDVAKMSGYLVGLIEGKLSIVSEG